MDIFKRIAVEINAKTEGLQRGMKQAETRTQAFNKTLRRLGVTIGTYFSARLLAREFKGTILDASQLIEVARGVGLTAAQFEKLRFIFEQMGADADQVRQALGDFQTRVGNPQTYGKYFRQIGLNPRELLKKNPEEQLLATLRALQKVENQSVRATYAGQVLGEESSRQLLRVINAPTKQFEDAVAKFDELGPRISKTQERSVIEMKNRFKVWEKLWEDFKFNLSDAFLTEENTQRIDQRIDQITTAIKEWSKANDILTASWNTLLVVVGGALTVFNPFLGALFGISAVVVTLKENWDDLWRSVDYVNEKIGKFFQSIPSIIGRALGISQSQQAPVSLPMNASGPGVGPYQYNVTQNIQIRGDRTFEDALREARRRADRERRSLTGR